jgi:hypothetical protein
MVLCRVNISTDFASRIIVSAREVEARCLFEFEIHTRLTFTLSTPTPTRQQTPSQPLILASRYPHNLLANKATHFLHVFVLLVFRPEGFDEGEHEVDAFHEPSEDLASDRIGWREW